MGLQANSSIIRLGLVGCRLSDPGIVAIAEFLAESNRIERLDMRNNDIGLGGLMALSLAARENISAFRIDLDKPVKDNNLPQELVVRRIVSYYKNSNYLFAVLIFTFTIHQTNVSVEKVFKTILTHFE